MVAHVVQHEKKTRSTQNIILYATRTIGMKHRVRCSAVGLRNKFLECDQQYAPVQCVKQHPSLDTFMPKRNVISPSVTKQATVVELDRKLPTMETMEAVLRADVARLHDCVASKSALVTNIDVGNAWCARWLRR
jgi:hypothetical protein